MRHHYLCDQCDFEWWEQTYRERQQSSCPACAEDTIARLTKERDKYKHLWEEETWTNDTRDRRLDHKRIERLTRERDELRKVTRALATLVLRTPYYDADCYVAKLVNKGLSMTAIKVALSGEGE